jgi:hypothetical protein
MDLRERKFLLFRREEVLVVCALAELSTACKHVLSFGKELILHIINLFPLSLILWLAFFPRSALELAGSDSCVWSGVFARLENRGEKLIVISGY